jgi:glucosamine-6-phosphate deaminase
LTGRDSRAAQRNAASQSRTGHGTRDSKSKAPSIRPFPGPRAATRAAAEHLAAVLRQGDPQRFVLASGRTMVPVYRELVRLHRSGRAPFSRCSTWNLDELAVAPEDPRSFRNFMEGHLFGKVDLAPGRVHFLRGDAPDRLRECRRFERELARAGRPDLALVGIGVNGHVAYLEPSNALPPRTSAVRLSASTRRRLAEDGLEPVPREALTMGIETILGAREIVLVAVGEEKAELLAKALTGRVTPRVPASFLSMHPQLTVFADREAASLL